LQHTDGEEHIALPQLHDVPVMQPPAQQMPPAPHAAP
jgi:hypothetical protein